MAFAELSEVAAQLSSVISKWGGASVKVTRVIDSRTLELKASNVPMDENSFWPADPNLYNCQLTEEERAQIYLRFQYSNQCQTVVLLLAMSLKNLCDEGVLLYHEGQPVVDIWIMNTTEFDVSDLLDTRVLLLKDADSDAIIPSVSTYQNMRMLNKISPSVLRNVAMARPEDQAIGKVLELHNPNSYAGSAPHWWIAAITEGSRAGVEERRMVHVDICGAAYDDKAFVMHNGSLVSCQVFATPEYDMHPAADTVLHLKHKFFLMPALKAKTASGQRVVSLQPKSVRHFRCLLKNDGSKLEVTTLPMFIDRKRTEISKLSPTFSPYITQVREEIYRKMKAGTPVVVRNLKTIPKLNKRRGRIHDSVTITPPKERIPVIVEGIENPLSLKIRCVCPVANRKQYLSHAELLKITKKVDTSPTLSRKQQAAFGKIIRQDPAIAMVFEKIRTTCITITSFGNKEFLAGMKKLLKSPVSRTFPAEQIFTFKSGVEIAEHPKSKEAFGIIKMMKEAKQRELEQYPSCMEADGGFVMREGSQVQLLRHKIVEKIKNDEGLNELFEKMCADGHYPNPVTNGVDVEMAVE